MQWIRYNIKGWVTNINNGTLTNDGITQTDPNALFGESITYYETSPLSGATPQYNGNISGMTWRNKIEASGKPGVTTGGQGYTIDYDNVNRLTEADYYTQSGSSFNPSGSNAFKEQVTGYDEMGNINRLDRNDKGGFALNSLFYTYGTYGNQLTSIYDNVLHPVMGAFSYDGNGNMLTDTYNGITLHYNYLDLVDTVYKGSSKLVFTYDAAGNKLYKQLITSGSVVSQRHYIEDAEVTATTSIATDGKIESVAMDEGRVVNTGAQGYKYEYNLQDHLFNNRVNFRVEHNGTVNLSQVQNYYPFGETMGDTTINYAISPVDLYQYSGKELQSELDLNTYDFGARNYDPVLGRWMSVDLMAENYEDESPYSYVANNPLNMIDPDGMQHLGTIPMVTGGTPDYGSTTGFITGAPAGGGSFPWGTVGKGVIAASALLQAYDAFNAFSMTAPKTTNFGILNTLQGNHLSLNIPSLQSFEVHMSLRWDPSIVTQQANDAVNEGVLAFRHVGSDTRTYQLGAPLFGKSHTDCSSFGCEIAITYGKGYINKSHPFPRGAALNQALWFQKFGYWSTNAKNIRAGDHIFWDRTKPGDHLSYHTAIVSSKMELWV